MVRAPQPQPQIELLLTMKRNRLSLRAVATAASVNYSSASEILNGVRISPGALLKLSIAIKRLSKTGGKK
jgi:hypothetical protein